MRAVMRLSSIALLGATLLLGTAGARAQPEIVIEAGSGAVLKASEPHTPWYPASLAKLMTLYLAFEAIRDGALALDEKLVVSKTAAAQPEVRLGLRTGASIKVEDAITAAAVASANDAAVLIAERIAGSEAVFAERMSARAHALGMTGSRFANATGLPGRGQRTTARDMALLALRMLEDFPRYVRYFGLRSGSYAGQRYSTVNGILGAIDGADGMKTGFTCDAGYNIVATAARGGRRLIAVVLGERSTDARNRRAAALLRESFEASAAGAGPVLRDLAAPPATLGAHPVPRLDRDACARSARQSYALGPGNLPGNGLLIGVFRTRDEAKRATAETLKALRGVVRGARPVYLEREYEQGRSYKALVVGLDRASLGKACLALREKGISCYPEVHEQINRPQYAYW